MSNSQCLVRIIRPTAVFSPDRRGGTLIVKGWADHCIFLRGLHYGSTSKERGRQNPPAGIIPRRMGDTVKDVEKEEVSRKKAERPKIEMKDWSERSPAWLNRDHDESDLVKHIEVLQRFADRYNAAYEHGQVKNESEEESRKRLLKILDKQPNKKFSTFVRAQGRKKKEGKKGEKEKTGGGLRSFITLAFEPRRKEALEPKPKPLVPSVKDYRNPDSVILKGFTNQSLNPKPRLYSLISPKLKNKDYEAYLKKTFPNISTKQQPAKEKKQEATIGDYYSNRYTQRPKKPVDSRGQQFLGSLRNTLVEERRAGTVTPAEKREPAIHPKTSLLVQKSHLPITKCYRMSNKDATQETPSSRPAPTSAPQKAPVAKEGTTSGVKTAAQKEGTSTSPAQNTLLNRIIKYFKR